MHVLVVDDNRTVLHMLKAKLSINGINVDITDSGAEAIKLALNISYQVIIMDLQMPAPDGITVTKFIRHKEKVRNNIIAFTGYEDGIDEESAKIFDKIIPKSEIENLMYEVMLFR